MNSNDISNKATVAVGMSGGVDSSVSAFLLKQAGYKVVGLFMRNWDDDESSCSFKEDADDVAKVCDTIGIPYYGLNFTQEYKERVFSDFIKELQCGRTPNPDVLCNREIKFKLLLEQALKLGADALATGHYAQNIEEDNKRFLRKGFDLGKDQTYFLYTLNQKILKRTLFPVGHLPKIEVRNIAKAAKLATADKKDSTGICFIGKRNFKDFLQRYIPFQNGEFQTLDGHVVGEHRGVAYYTIGQRKGIGIGGMKDLDGSPWFVVKKDVQKNIVYVAQGFNHPALFHTALAATDASWILGEMPLFPYACTAKIRYRQEDQACVIESCKDGVLFVRFQEPQRAITPEQSIVFYQGNTCLGGAIIQSAFADCHKKSV